MEKEKISVVIPTYNRARLIESSVKSVLSQTYGNLEIIVVDDASTDNTLEIVKAISDSRVTYIRLEKNSGACAARNKGIEQASGEYIAFNDSDDQWIPAKLQRQYDSLKENNADIVLCKMKCYDEGGNFHHIFPNLNASAYVDYKSLLQYNCASTQTFFGKSECFKEIPFDTLMPRMQDWDEALRISQKYTVFYLDDVLVNTFIQADSISAHPEKGLAAMERLFEKHEETISKFPKIAQSFFKKKASFSCKCGKNPIEEMRFLATHFPTLENLAKYLLTKTGIYLPLFMKGKKT